MQNDIIREAERKLMDVSRTAGEAAYLLRKMDKYCQERMDSSMTNKEWLSTLSAEEWWNKVDWLLHEFGMRWDNTRLAIIDWLEEEHDENFD